MQPGSPSPCVVCGTARTQNEAVQGDTCPSLRCKTAVTLEVRKRDKAEFDAKCDAIADTFAARRGVKADLVARVPFLSGTLVETPKDAHRAFRKTLRAAFRETYGDAGKGTLAGLYTDQDDAPDPILDTSCIACRGQCCRKGAGHAFLNREYLPTIFQRNTRQSPAALYREYVRLLPREAYKDSCHYHTDLGCALPREIRSPVCNKYQCDERKKLQSCLENAPNSATLVVAMEGKEVQAAAVSAPNKPLSWVSVETPDQD